MKQKYLLLTIILFMCLFSFSSTSLALIPGDFGSANNGPPDGVVDFEDLMIFAMAYGSTPSDSNWNEVCDIYPDDKIDFEDLMIFAMHYGEFLVHNLTKDIYYNTIQAALDDAIISDGDIIEVADGTYNESITFPIGKLVTLQSASGIRDNVIIQGANNLSTVTINDSSTGTTLSGFTITHTGGNTGRGIYIGSGNLIIDNCIISGNTTDDNGGGIYNYYGTLTITSSTISENTATDGGGIYIYDGGLPTIQNIIQNNTISENTATDGGGIYIFNSSSIIQNNTISENTANRYGAGIAINLGASLDIQNLKNIISRNNAIERIDIEWSSPTIQDNIISKNSATDDGGGIAIYCGVTFDIQNNTISENTTDTNGGGIYIWYGWPTIQDNTISENTADTNGGGIYIESGSPIIGGVDENDTGNFNTICGNTPDQIYPDSYPNNYIDEYCP